MTDIELPGLPDIAKAMSRAFDLGQEYWALADSESLSDHRKAGEIAAKFETLASETESALSAIAARQEGFVLVPRVWLADIAWIADNHENLSPGVGIQSLRKIRDKIDERLAQEDAAAPKADVAAQQEAK